MSHLTGPKVLVLSASAGAGHLRAADALVSAFELKGVSARHVDVLYYTNAVFRRFYSDLYIELVNRRPEVLNWMYNRLDRPWKYQKRRLMLDRLNTGPLMKFLKKEAPDIVVCTHFLPAEILLHMRRKKILDIPLGIVITDYDTHAMWLYKGVKWYFTAHAETARHILKLGIAPETVYVTGIPVSPDFSGPFDQACVRKELGLRPELTTLLISAGGFGVGPVEAIVEALSDIKTPFQAAVIAGRNEKLKAKLEDLSGGVGYPLKVVGYTTRMHRWMAASDMLIGKPGGLTSSEALAMGLVLCIVNPVPGQEERNSDHFLEEGVAIRSNNLPVLGWKIDSLLKDTARYRGMRQKAKKFGRPEAAKDIVNTVLKG